MIRTRTLLKLTHQLLDVIHQSDLGVDPEELLDTIHAFFTTDPDIVGTENEGKPTVTMKPSGICSFTQQKRLTSYGQNKTLILTLL